MRGGTMTRGSALLLAVAVVLAVPALAGAQAADVVQYYHTDAIGSVRRITDATGQVVGQYDYRPFGEPWNTPVTPDRWQFAGKERDRETGFDYFGARYYANATGRFTTVDPVITLEENLADPQRWNRYAYARNNPLRYTDPDGRAIDTIWDVANLVYDVYTGVKTGNWTDFGADLAAAAIPFVPAGASKLRHLGRIDDALDAAKALDNTADTSRAARRAAMREQGIPTSQQPTWQVDTPGGRSYEYEVPAPGGGNRRRS